MNPIIRVNKKTIIRNEIDHEIWKPLILDNQYSNYIISNYGRIYSYNTMNILSLYEDRDGYLHVSLSHNNKHYTCAIHRLVMITFNSIPDYKNYQVNHIDSNKQNNYILNLEWCISKYNINHAIQTGLINQKCENHHAAYLTNKQVHYICKLLQDCKTYDEICDIIKISKLDKKNLKNIIGKINNGYSWVEISKNYNIIKKNQHHIKYDKYIVHQICKYLEKGKNYEEICKIMNVENYDDFKKFMYRLVSKNIFNHIKCQYKIQIPISLKPPLFSDKQIHVIYQMLKDEYNSISILNKLNIDINSLDNKTKHCMINCISNIKNKKTFKKISDKYFE